MGAVQVHAGRFQWKRYLVPIVLKNFDPRKPLYEQDVEILAGT